MRRSRFSGEQIISMLTEPKAELKIADVYRKHRITDATLFASLDARIAEACSPIGASAALLVR